MRCRDYLHGWIDNTIHDFVEHFPFESTELNFALITCLDSEPNPSTLLAKSPELQAIADKATIVGTGILLPVGSLADLFFGFDEVWFFPSDQIEPKPDLISIVGPRKIDKAKVDKICDWLQRNDCLLGLGDGVGLNFITHHDHTLKWIKPNT